MTQEQRALTIVRIVGEAIQGLGSVPSGHLYAHLMDLMPLDAYQQILSVLTKAGLIRVENNLITWIGPA